MRASFFKSRFDSARRCTVDAARVLGAWRASGECQSLLHDAAWVEKECLCKMLQRGAIVIEWMANLLLRRPKHTLESCAA